MAIRKILTTPNNALNALSVKVVETDNETKKIVEDLIDTLNNATEPEGSGLAAPQIGIPKRICVIRRFIPNPAEEEKHIKKDYVLINPKIISLSKETEERFEGCLSVPDEYGMVKRPKKVKVKATNEHGEIVRINTSGVFARSVQHEIDHLDGIIFTSKVIGKTFTSKELDEMEDK